MTSPRTIYPARFRDRPILAQRAPVNPLEALVQGRLDDIYADVPVTEARRATARRGAPPGPAEERPSHERPGHERPGHERLVALRIRIGRGLVAIGAAVAGEQGRAQDRPRA